MEILKSNNQNLESTSINKMISLAEVLPYSLKIYNQDRIVLDNNAAKLELDLIEFEKKCLTQLTSIFGIQGELDGFFICQTPASLSSSYFSEVMNILLGQFLTNLDSKHSILSELTPPIVFNGGDKNKDKILRLNQRLSSFMKDSKIFEINYLIEQGNHFYPVQIILVSKFKGQKVC